MIHGCPITESFNSGFYAQSYFGAWYIDVCVISIIANKVLYGRLNIQGIALATAKILPVFIFFKN